MIQHDLLVDSLIYKVSKSTHGFPFHQWHLQCKVFSLQGLNYGQKYTLNLKNSLSDCVIVHIWDACTLNPEKGRAGGVQGHAWILNEFETNHETLLKKNTKKMKETKERKQGREEITDVIIVPVELRLVS